MSDRTISTERLLLRRWRDDDRQPFAALNADPAVMATIGAPLTRSESDAFADRIERHFTEHGFGLFAVEAPGKARFIGFVGLSVPRFEAHFTPCVEIGWRLAHGYWGNGYAPEAALAVLDFGHGTLAFDEIVSFTAALNTNSQRVMQKIGMVRDPADDFEHPHVPRGDRLRRHVLYRSRR